MRLALAPALQLLHVTLHVYIAAQNTQRLFALAITATAAANTLLSPLQPA
jgi:hypothetical protein